MPPIIVVGFQNEFVEQTLGKNYDYALQAEQNGTAHAVLSAQKLISGENILVLYGDMPFISAASMQQLIALHESRHGIVSMFTATIPNFEGSYKDFESFGRIIRDNEGNVVKIQEFGDSTEAQKKSAKSTRAFICLTPSGYGRIWKQSGTGTRKTNFI